MTNYQFVESCDNKNFEMYIMNELSVSVVYVRHSKGETNPRIYVDVQNANKAALANHFEYQFNVDTFLNFKQLKIFD